MTANEGIRRTDDPQNKTSQSQKRFPHSQEPNNSSRSTACRFRTAQTTRRDVSELIKMFDGIYQHFKHLSSQRISHIRHHGREGRVLVGCLRDARVKSRDNTTVFNHSRLQVQSTVLTRHTQQHNDQISVCLYRLLQEFQKLLVSTRIT